MKSRKPMIIAAAALATAGIAAFVYLPSDSPSLSVQKERTSLPSMAAQDDHNRDRTTEPTPAFSESTFELPPSDATGSYKAPSATSAESEQEVD